jgi:hypothetical protein
MYHRMASLAAAFAPQAATIPQVFPYRTIRHFPARRSATASRARSPISSRSSRGPLKKGGFLTRDSRVIERKKYGRKKARRSFQFSRR